MASKKRIATKIFNKIEREVQEIFTDLRTGKEVDHGRVLRFLFIQMLQHLEEVTAAEDGNGTIAYIMDPFDVDDFLTRLEQNLDKEIKCFAAVGNNRSRIIIRLRVVCDGTHSLTSEEEEEEEEEEMDLANDAASASATGDCISTAEGLPYRVRMRSILAQDSAADQARHNISAGETSRETEMPTGLTAESGHEEEAGPNNYVIEDRRKYEKGGG